MNNNLTKQEIINKAINFHLQGNIQEATKLYQYCINQGFNDPKVFSNYGTILQNLRKLKEAEISYRKAIELKPNYAKAHSNLGIILRSLGKLQDAELSYRKAIEINPNFAEALSNMGNILSDLGKIKELVQISESTLKSRSINIEYKLLASLRLTIANLLRGDFPETLLNINKTNNLINQGAINNFKDELNKKYSFNFSRFLTSLYPLLEKENLYPDSRKIPHFGESHCISFAHQTLSLSCQLKQIQPVLIAGGKAWHFANSKNNQWKSSLTHQMKNHAYSDKVFISFGEIDCRKDEGILIYAIKNEKNISKICETTIKGYLDYMEEILTPNYSKKYYFGIPAPTIGKELTDELDFKRIKMVRLYNSIFKKEVLSRGSYFLDVYKLTSNKEGLNNNIYMCDDTHLSPKYLSILFENYLCKS